MVAVPGRATLSRLRSGHGRTATVLAIGAVVIYTLWGIITAPLYKYPPGIDTMGHMTKVWYLAEQWKKLNFSDWFPYWYNGSTVTQYYPPLSAWICAAIQIVTGNLMATYIVVTTACLLLAGWGAAAVARRFGGWSAGLVAGVFYATGPYTLFTTFVDGTLGRIISLPLYAWLLDATIDVVKKADRRAWIKGAILVTSLILAHAMHAYLLVVALLIFALLLAMGTRWPLRRFGLVCLQVLVGGTLSAFWALPGATQLETSGVPYAPPERVVSYSSTWRVITGDPHYPYFGLVLFAMAVAGAVLAWSLSGKRWQAAALSGSLLASMSLMYGPSNPLYELLPMKNSLFPLRFLNAAYLPASILAGLAVSAGATLVHRRWKGLPWRSLAMVLASGAILAGLIDNTGYRLRIHQASYPLLAEMSSIVPRPGQDPFDRARLAVALPDYGPEQAFFPVVQGLNCTAGWNLEGTPHLKTFHEHNVALANHRPGYLVRSWLRWNARSALVQDDMKELIAALQDAGWRRLASHGGVTLLADPDLPSYFYQLDTRGLVVGRSDSWVTSLFPGLNQGESPRLGAYDQTYLDQFQTVFLYDFLPVSTTELEDEIRDLLKAGKRVVVDLSRSGMSVLFDVYVVEKTAAGSLAFTPGAHSPFSAGVTVPFHDWTGATYQGLDEEWLLWPTDAQDNDRLAVAGVRYLPEGPLYFVGMHLARLPDASQVPAVTSVLGAALGMADPSSGIKPTSFPVQQARWSGHGVDFSYSSARDTPVVVSVTWTPRWKAFLDGHPLRVYRHENLVLLTLPAGDHRVRLLYGRTWVTAAGWVVTIMGAVLLFLVQRLHPDLKGTVPVGPAPGRGIPGPSST